MTDSKFPPYPFSDEDWLFIGAALALLKRIMEVADDRLPLDKLEKLAQIRSNPDLNTTWLQLVNQLHHAKKLAESKGLV